MAITHCSQQSSGVPVALFLIKLGLEGYDFEVLDNLKEEEFIFH